MGNIGKRPELKRKQICLFYLAMCFVSLFLMVKATPDDAMLSQQSGISEMSRADKEYAWECKIVCVNRYCMNLLYAPYWGKQR